MPLLILVLISVWILPLLKITSKVALWHLLLLGLLFFLFINRNHFFFLIEIIKKNFRFICALILMPVLMIIRDTIGTNLEYVLNDYILRGLIGLLFALCIATFMRFEKNRAIILKTLGIIFAIQAFVGILQFLNPEYFYDLPQQLATIQDRETTPYGGRVRGLFMDIHVFGQNMLSLSVLYLSINILRHNDKSSFKSIFYLTFITALGILSILVTYLRAAYLILILNIIILFLLLPQDRKNVKKGLLIFGIFIILILGVMEYTGTFKTKSFERIKTWQDVASDRSRLGSFDAAMRAFNENEIFGVGGRQVFYDVAIHNVFLRVLAFYGIIGLIFYLLFYIGLLNQIKKIGISYSEYRIGLFLWLLSYVLYGMSHTGGFWIGGLHEWTFVGIILGFNVSTHLS